MIEAIIGYAPSAIPANAGRSLEDDLKKFEFIRIRRRFASRRLVRVEADIASVQELQAKIGQSFIAEPRSTMMPL